MELTKSLRLDVVKDLHPRPVVLAAPGQSIRHTIRQMQQHRTGCVMICNQAGGAVGIFTEGDVLRRVIGEGVELDKPLEQVMSTTLATVKADDPIPLAVELMHSRGLRHLPVVNDAGEPTGVVSVKRVMEYLVEHFPQEVYNLPPNPSPELSSREGA